MASFSCSDYSIRCTSAWIVYSFMFLLVQKVLKSVIMSLLL